MGLVTKYSTLFIFFEPNQYLNWARNNMETGKYQSDLFVKIYNIKENTSSTEAIEQLAKFLKQQNTGIILMEMSANNEFKRLEVDSDNKVLRKKCNN